MKRKIVWYSGAALLTLVWHAFGQAEFSGFLADDQPIFEGFLTHIQEKNEHAGVEPIANLDMGAGETVVRIYEGFGEQAFRRGGHRLTLFEVYRTQNSARGSLYPPCPPRSEEVLEDATELWDVLVEQDIFSIKDSRTVPDYPGILDGTSYVVQIMNETGYREYYVDNPREYDSPDNFRLLSIVEEARRQFGTPECFTR